MTPDVWLLLTAAVVVLLPAAWVAWTLTRLRRLEARVGRAWTALDAQLTRRAALAAELARALADLLADPVRRAELSAAGPRAAAAYDWKVLARRILAVYETVVPPEGGGVTAAEHADVPHGRSHR